MYGEPMSNKLANQLVAVLLVLHFLLIISTFRDYGMSWDQPGLHEYGQTVVRFYTSLGRDDAAQTHELRIYGGLFEILSSVVESLTHLGWLEARNLTSALFGLLGTWASFRLGAIAFGPLVGLTAALFLTLTPTYYGHEFINPKDIPFAALYLLSLYYVVKMALDFPDLRWSDSLKAGLAVGAALGVRAGGLILFPLLVGAIFASLLWNVKGKGLRVLVGKLLTTGVMHAVAVLLLAWLVMLLSWPFAWKAHHWRPFLRAPFFALSEFSHFTWYGRAFFGGQLFKATELPSHYLVTIFANCLPEFILAGWLLGLIALLRVAYSGRRALHRKSLAAIIIFAASVTPLAFIIITHAPVYDNGRHVLFAVSPLIILSAAGVWAFVESFKNETIRLVCVIAYTLAILTTIVDMRVLHPYEYTYFNRLIAGGMEQANERFELEYWGTSFREAADWLNEYYRPHGVSEIVYTSNSLPEMVDYYMRQAPAGEVVFRRVLPDEKAKVYLSFRRQRQQTERGFGHVVHTIEREGVPFLDIVEL
jgi:dolichyl-phosphate-mannose-protein mannosyltransferase